MAPALVQTMNGPVDAGALGFTLPHEHLFLLSPGLITNWPHAFDRAGALARAEAMLRAAHDAGVRTIIDLTTIDLGREIALVAEAAATTSVNVVVATGLHLRPPGFVNRKSPDAIVDLFVHDLTVGIAGSGVRAAVIKIASGAEVTAQNDVHLRAAARAHLATGAPIITHSDAATRSGLRQVEVFADEGVNLTRVIIGHVGDTDDIGYLEQLASSGVTLGMDRYGTNLGLKDDRRNATIAELCRRGYAKQLVLSHDTNCYSDTFPWSTREQRLPNWHFTLIPTTIIPVLHERGVTEQQVFSMTHDNVRRLFGGN